MSAALQTFTRITEPRLRLVLALYGAITETSVMPARTRGPIRGQRGPKGVRRPEAGDEYEGYPTTGGHCHCHTGRVCDTHFWMVLRALIDDPTGAQ